MSKKTNGIKNVRRDDLFELTSITQSNNSSVFTKCQSKSYVYYIRTAAKFNLKRTTQ